MNEMHDQAPAPREGLSAKRPKLGLRYGGQGSPRPLPQARGSK